MNDRITHDPHNDGIDRRGMLKCMAWSARAWPSPDGGVLTSRLLGGKAAEAADKGDSPSSRSATATSASPRTRTRTWPERSNRRGPDQRPAGRPPFCCTGDLTHLSKPEESTPSPRSSRGKAGKKFFTPANTTSSATTASATWSATAGGAGTRVAEF